MVGLGVILNLKVIIFLIILKVCPKQHLKQYEITVNYILCSKLCICGMWGENNPYILPVTVSVSVI